MTADEQDVMMAGVLNDLKAKLEPNVAIVVILAKQEPEGVRMAGYSNVEGAAARLACSFGPRLFSDAATRRVDQ